MNMDNHNGGHHNSGQHHDSDFNKHEGHKTASFLKKFWISFILTIPILLLSDLPQKFLKSDIFDFFGTDYVALILGTIIFFYGGWVFIVGAFREIKAKLPGMMVLIALAISTAYIYSVFSVLFGIGHDLLWELATLVVVMLLGHYVEMRAILGAQGALKELLKLLPDVAEVVRKTKTEIIPVSELKAGDVVLIRPGGKIPADGVVVEGDSDVDESMITGESAPVAKKIGSETIAGTANGDGLIKIGVSKTGESTYLAGVMRLVAQARASKSRMQVLADRAAYYLTIIAVFSGILTFLLWFGFKGDFSFALERMVAVLVIACPHALGLAIPLVVSISTTLAAKSGLLIKDRRTLEEARKINIVLFDKTGTLTKGEYGVEKIIAVGKADENRVIQLAASVDAGSEHVVSKAIVREAEKRKLILLKAVNFKRLSGRGVRAKLGNSEIFAGGEGILTEAKITLSKNIREQINELAENGRTVIFVAADNRLEGIISLADLIRDESREAVGMLKKMGLKVAMITGDSDGVARWVARDLKIDEYFAKVIPQEKAGKVKTLQFRGFKVAMVGDGINDSPALTQADAGIAIGAGTNVAIESAGIILAKNDPRDIVKIINLSRLTYKKMIQNLFWATGYNVVALPLAAGVLANYGILLQPAISALLMSLSTVVVAINALFLAKAVLK